MSAQTINIDELERLALAATAGPWFSIHNGTYHDVSIDNRQYAQNVANVIGSPDFADQDAKHTEKQNAAYIAAANPATMLQLIAIIREKLASALVEMFHHPDAEADLEAIHADSNADIHQQLEAERARNTAILAAFRANLRKAGACDDVIEEIISRIEVK